MKLSLAATFLFVAGSALALPVDQSTQLVRRGNFERYAACHDDADLYLCSVAA